MPKEKYGTYKKLDIGSVKSNALKTINFLKAKLPSSASHAVNVIFLGEEHGNLVDVPVAGHILMNPPVLNTNNTRVIFERGLNYPIGVGMDRRTETINYGLNHKARSKKMAEMIQDAFDEHNKELVYIACGVNHAQEIFDALIKTMRTNFGFIVKPSSTD